MCFSFFKEIEEGNKNILQTQIFDEKNHNVGGDIKNDCVRMVAFHRLPQNPASSPKPDNIQRVIQPFFMIYFIFKPQRSGLSAHIPCR